MQWHIGQDGGLPEVTFASDTLSTKFELSALLDRVCGEFGHGRQAARIGQGAHGCAFCGTVAHLKSLGVLDHFGRKFLLDTFMHQKASGSDTNLSSVAKLSGPSRLHSKGNVCVFGNDHWGMATQFHRDTFHVLTRQCSQLLANRC